MQGQNLQAQKSINFLILSEDEPNFKGKLPPEYIVKPVWIQFVLTNTLEIHIKFH